ncbi:GNAT family N-acetyltransferase [Aspergillus brunneoviolaceus CBS 621.78]|uniref:Acyl-CoA N-acyltransferase n=1 Tax=Aspergillus brunneoviolaceus CBS 621.78 TaxID=1450534 RepID=A0ACD1G630_9EURO|nr:acyl-CoA N-acyltransferase [Aspergillus brunneoviolaceus CBS 621.78]RAH44632.1 acyl-CoA N-acyltransferase [Aspergillus brunneoviolaceus CBS 621.78]
MAHFHFRLATAADAPRLRDLIESAFRAADTRADWTGDLSLGARFHVQLDDMLARIANPDGAFLVATTTTTEPQDGDQKDEAEEVVACVNIFKKQLPDRDAVARLALLAVDQRHQQGGLGRRVMVQAEKLCREMWGVRRTGLNALDTRVALIRWYERCGYVRTGEVTSISLPPDELRLVEFEKELAVGAV